MIRRTLAWPATAFILVLALLVAAACVTTMATGWTAAWTAWTVAWAG